MKHMSRFFFAVPVLALSLIVGACSYNALTGAGVSTATANKIVAVEQTAVTDGTLFCQAAGTLYEVAGVSVINAGQDAVAAGCTGLTVAGQVINGATPGPATVGQNAVVATTTTAAAAKIAASKPAASG